MALPSKRETTDSGASDGLEFVVVPRRHYLRWAQAAVVVIFLALVFRTLANAEIEWSAVPDFATSPIILTGIKGTLALTFGAMGLAIVVGVVLAVMRGSSNVVLRWVAALYVWFFRGIPALVQVLLWFNIALVVKTVNIPLIYSGSTNTLITPYIAALLGLGISESAFMSEIVRAGILSVDPGQNEAARSIGLTSGQITRRIVLPQALRVIVPPTSNEFIAMLKYSSLAFVVSYSELLSQAAKLYTKNLQVIEVLLSVTIWYLVLTTVFSIVQYLIERRLLHEQAPARLISRLRGNFTWGRA